MKKLLYIIPFMFLLSCDFLEVDPVGKNTIPTFFSDMEGIRSALPGAYSATYDYYSNEFTKYPDVAGNMLRLKSTVSGSDMLDQYNYTSDPDQETSAVGYIWRRILIALANANNIIEYEPQLENKFPQNTNELRRIRAEALYLRALCHFDLCRSYAQPYNYTSDASHLGIPILLRIPGADENVGRSTIKDVYAQILTDLKNAADLFDAYGSQGSIWYASKNAVLALQTRVYLYMEDWNGVVNSSTPVIEQIPLAQGNDYIAMFNGLVEGKESILRLNGKDKASKLATFYDPSSPIAIPADTLISLFDAEDIRLQLLSFNGSAACCKYYITANVTEKEKHYDPFVARVSELYLCRAEAYLKLDNTDAAATDIKAIIARAHNKTIDEVTIATDTESLRRLINEERIKELCFEGHSLWDITRRKENLIRETNTNSSVSRVDYPSQLFILPIPQKELDANTNMQPN